MKSRRWTQAAAVVVAALAVLIGISLLSHRPVEKLPATAAPITHVRLLAIALNETSEPTRVDGGWRSGDLLVTDAPGNPWTWGVTWCGRDRCTSGSASSGIAYPCADGVKSCPAAIIERVCRPGGDGNGCALVRRSRRIHDLTESQKLAATAKIRVALGLAGAPTDVRVSVETDPVIDGLPASGTARLFTANGYLSTRS